MIRSRLFLAALALTATRPLHAMPACPSTWSVGFWAPAERWPDVERVDNPHLLHDMARELYEHCPRRAPAAAVARLAVGLPAGGKADLVIGCDDAELGSRLESGPDGGMRLTLGRPRGSPASSLDAAITLAGETVQKRLA